MRSKIRCFLLGAILVAVLCVGAFLVFSDTVSIYDYALGMEREDMFIRGDGSIWVIIDNEDPEKIRLTPYEEHAEVPISTEVKAKTSEDMELYEYMLASQQNDDVFIRQDGRVYYLCSFWQNKNISTDREATVSPVLPLDDIETEQRLEGISVAGYEMKDNWVGFIIKNDSLIGLEEPTLDLSVKVGDEWYTVLRTVSGSGILNDKFEKGSERTFGFSLTTGMASYEQSEVPIPAGRYRVELKNKWSGKLYYAFELDLGRQDGEYSIKIAG